MKLDRVQVQYFRNILDSTEVEIQGDVTCLVGKNESGKTAFLEALRRLNPAQGKPTFVIGQHYPAWLEKKHRRQGRDLEAGEAVTAWFTLEQVAKNALTALLGEGVFKSDEITVSRIYGGTLYYGYSTDEKRAVENLIENADLPNEAASVVGACDTFASFQSKVTELRADDDEQAKASGEKLNAEITAYLNGEEGFTPTRFTE